MEDLEDLNSPYKIWWTSVVHRRPVELLWSIEDLEVHRRPGDLLKSMQDLEIHTRLGGLLYFIEDLKVFHSP